MEERVFEAIVAKLMTDERNFPLDIDVKSAWMILSCLQLATRIPNLSDATKEFCAGIGRQFQRPLEELYPEAKVLMDMGWDEAFDVGDDDDELVTVVGPITLETGLELLFAGDDDDDEEWDSEGYGDDDEY